jgi:hypothetical protein
MPIDSDKNYKIMDNIRFLVDDPLSFWVRPYMFKGFYLNTLYIYQEVLPVLIKYQTIIFSFSHVFRQFFHDLDSHDK